MRIQNSRLTDRLSDHEANRCHVTTRVQTSRGRGGRESALVLGKLITPKGTQLNLNLLFREEKLIYIFYISNI